MADLTIWQAKILERADKTGRIAQSDEELCPGIHFCPDWDGLAVCDDSPEAANCYCDKPWRS